MCWWQWDVHDWGVVQRNTEWFVVMGSGQFFAACLGQPFLVWVWVWKISPKNLKFFNFFPFGSKKSHQVKSKSTQVKDWSAHYLLHVKSMLRSGHGPSQLVWGSANVECQVMSGGMVGLWGVILGYNLRGKRGLMEFMMGEKGLKMVSTDFFVDWQGLQLKYLICSSSYIFTIFLRPEINLLKTVLQKSSL